MPDIVPDGQPYVFISYATADRERVLPIVAALTRAGISIWRDQESIAGGTSYGPAIASAIRGSAAVVILCSQASLNSRNVRQEMAIAWKHERPYLPLLLDPITTLPEEVEYWLEGAQWIEILDNAEDAWLPNVMTALVRLGMLAASDATQPVLTSRPVNDPTSQSMVSIPTPVSALFGRQDEIEDVRNLLRTARLVTLTGPGGTGKTRLALAVAGQLGQAFPDGVVFVSLAAVRDASLVVPAIASALAIREAANEPLVAILTRALAHHRLLLVLDNFEHVTDAAIEVGTLVTACPHLHVLATSRVPLHLSGEREYAVAPLAVPDPTESIVIEELAATPAVALFVDRAQSVKRGFRLTAENAEAVAAICQRLDGLPLAIELAAARVKLLAPAAISARLERPLSMLTGGARDLPERHQTIRATIQWSYDLLTPAEQQFFRRLSVFVGGWTLDGAEAVAGSFDEVGANVFERLASLVEKSLVTQTDETDDDTRFTMLMMIREFGLEQLAAHNESTAGHSALGAYFVRLVDEADLNAERGIEFVRWLDRIERELDNLRVVLDWAIDRDADTAFRLLVGVWHVWYTRGHMSEGRRFLHLALDRWSDIPAPVRSRALYQAGTLASWQGDIDVATELHEEQLQLSRERNDPSGVSRALFGLGRAATFAGDAMKGRDYYEQSLALARHLADQSLIEAITGNLAGAYSLLGDYDRALELNDEALAIARANGSLLGLQIRLTDRGELMFERGQIREARLLYAEALVLAQQIGVKRYVADIINAFGKVAATEGDLEREVILVGASDRARYSLNYRPLPVFFPSVEDRLVLLRQELGDERFDTLVARGATMTTDEAIAFALGDSQG